MSHLAHPDVLVSTQWVADNLDNPSIQIVESNEDILLYDTGHIPGAVNIDWQSDLQDQVVRDYVAKEEFEDLVSILGITNDTTVVFYGDKNNWWACYAFWTFKMFGHEKCKIMDGGREKWLAENRPITKEVEHKPESNYKVTALHEEELRAFRDDVIQHLKADKLLIDVRSPGEFTGELLHMEGYMQEGALRGGHIPGAKNVPWNENINDEATFKRYEDLKNIYMEQLHLKQEDDIIVYCRIGERSAMTWFVLTYLLGFKNVRNYDGSWTEWGNLVRVPIER